jgi:hypothetical protein
MDLEVRMLSDDRRPGTGLGRTRRAVSSVSLAALLALVPLTACSSDSESSTSPDSGAATTPAGSAGSEQSSETAAYFYPPVEGATLTYRNSLDIGEFTTEVTVNSVTSGADGQTIVATEVSTGDETVTVERTLRIAPDGSLHLSITPGLTYAFGPWLGLTYEGDDIVIPSLADLEAGRTSSGTFVEIEEDGERGDIAYTVRGAGREQVTVPAGTAEAYVVEIDLTFTMDNETVSRTGRYWLVPGFGQVRQEIGSSLGDITIELVSSSVPLP